MELRHLRYFVVVTEEASFSGAAKRLRVSQPAISRQIKTLEDEVGSALFVRDKAGPRLTAAGSTLLGHAGKCCAAASTHSLRSEPSPAAEPVKW